MVKSSLGILFLKKELKLSISERQLQGGKASDPARGPSLLARLNRPACCRWDEAFYFHSGGGGGGGGEERGRDRDKKQVTGNYPLFSHITPESEYNCFEMTR